MLVLERNHYIFLVTWSLLKTLIPSLYVRNMRPFNLQVEVAVQLCPDWNVGESYRVPNQELPICQRFIQQLKMGSTAI